MFASSYAAESTIPLQRRLADVTITLMMCQTVGDQLFDLLHKLEVPPSLEEERNRLAAAWKAIVSDGG